MRTSIAQGQSRMTVTIEYSKRYEQQINDLQNKINMLNGNTKGVKKKIDYSVNIINNLTNIMMNGSVEMKIKVLGSMFPEKIEFDGKNIEPNPTTKCLTLSISKPMSYEETKKKKEKDFRLSPIQYPEPGSNRHGLPHWCLRPARLPIPPSGLKSGAKILENSELTNF